MNKKVTDTKRAKTSNRNVKTRSETSTVISHYFDQKIPEKEPGEEATPPSSKVKKPKRDKSVNPEPLDTSVDDFETPKPVKRIIPSIFKPKFKPKGVSTKARPSSLKRITEKSKNFLYSNDDVNLALALSRSLQEENSSEVDAAEGSKNELQDLKAFKFQSAPSCSKTVYQLKAPTVTTKAPRLKRKKFNPFTSTLIRRSNDDRARILNAKVGDIICQTSGQGCPDYYDNFIVNLNGPMCEESYCYSKILFLKSALIEQSIEAYYTRLVPIIETKAGSLLKNWHKIQGRDITPPREIKQTIASEDQHLNQLANLLKEELSHKNEEYVEPFDGNRPDTTFVLPPSEAMNSYVKTPPTSPYLTGKPKNDVILENPSTKILEKQKPENSKISTEFDINKPTHIREVTQHPTNSLPCPDIQDFLNTEPETSLITYRSLTPDMFSEEEVEAGDIICCESYDQDNDYLSQAMVENAEDILDLTQSSTDQSLKNSPSSNSFDLPKFDIKYTQRSQESSLDSRKLNVVEIKTCNLEFSFENLIPKNEIKNNSIIDLVDSSSNESQETMQPEDVSDSDLASEVPDVESNQESPATSVESVISDPVIINSVEHGTLSETVKTRATSRRNLILKSNFQSFDQTDLEKIEKSSERINGEVENSRRITRSLRCETVDLKCTENSLESLKITENSAINEAGGDSIDTLNQNYVRENMGSESSKAFSKLDHVRKRQTRSFKPKTTSLSDIDSLELKQKCVSPKSSEVIREDDYDINTCTKKLHKNSRSNDSSDEDVERLNPFSMSPKNEAHGSSSPPRKKFKFKRKVIGDDVYANKSEVENNSDSDREYDKIKDVPLSIPGKDIPRIPKTGQTMDDSAFCDLTFEKLDESELDDNLVARNRPDSAKISNEGIFTPEKVMENVNLEPSLDKPQAEFLTINRPDEIDDFLLGISPVLAGNGPRKSPMYKKKFDYKKVKQNSIKNINSDPTVDNLVSLNIDKKRFIFKKHKSEASIEKPIKVSQAELDFCSDKNQEGLSTSEPKSKKKFDFKKHKSVAGIEKLDLSPPKLIDADLAFDKLHSSGKVKNKSELAIQAQICRSPDGSDQLRDMYKADNQPVSGNKPDKKFIFKKHKFEASVGKLNLSPSKRIEADVDKMNSSPNKSALKKHKSGHIEKLKSPKFTSPPNLNSSTTNLTLFDLSGPEKRRFTIFDTSGYQTSKLRSPSPPNLNSSTANLTLFDLSVPKEHRFTIFDTSGHETPKLRKSKSFLNISSTGHKLKRNLSEISLSTLRDTKIPQDNFCSEGISSQTESDNDSVVVVDDLELNYSCSVEPYNDYNPEQYYDYMRYDEGIYEEPARNVSFGKDFQEDNSETPTGVDSPKHRLHPVDSIAASSQKNREQNESILKNDSLDKVLQSSIWDKDMSAIPNSSIPPKSKLNTPNKLPTPVRNHVDTPITQMVVKNGNVTPMPDYESMNTPIRNKELEKFGLKPLKRRRANQMLQYIYEQTHPLEENSVATPTQPKDQDDKPKKRRRKNSPKVVSNSNLDDFVAVPPSNIKIVGDLMSKNETEDDLIFESKPSLKVASCRLPFHIAFHNYVCTKSDLKFQILTYEPIQVETIYKDFRELGFKYHIDDIIKFFDNKCITIKTFQNAGRNNRAKLK